jgi:gliding motility-associated-like protein
LFINLFISHYYSDVFVSFSRVFSYFYHVMRIGINSFVLLLASTLSVGALAQIPNPGFESFNGMPNNVGQFYLADGWTNAGSLTSTPDYYHYFGSLGGDIPETPVAIVNSWEGNAVMGFVACGVAHTNFREYISTELATPLVVGTQYLVSFRLTNGDITSLSASGLGASHIGVAFTENAPQQMGNDPLEITPQFYIDTVMYSREWKHVDFIFTATEAQKYMTVGIFGNDDGKIIEVREGNPQFGYYFVDDFRMVELSDDFDPTQAYYIDDSKADVVDPNSGQLPIGMQPEFFIPNAFTPNGDGDNDNFLPVSNVIESFELEIFSRWGELLFKCQASGLGWDGTIAGEGATAGVYVWQITFDKQDNSEAWVEKTLHGTVNLIR